MPGSRASGPTPQLRRQPDNRHVLQPVRPERLPNTLQTPALRLRHIQRANAQRESTRARKQEIYRRARLRQQDGRDERNEEVREAVRGLPETGGCGARRDGLDFTGEHLEPDGPGHAVGQGEDVDGDDDDPAASAISGVHAVGGIEAANEPHGGAYDEAAVDGRGTAAPYVREQDGWDG